MIIALVSERRGIEKSILAANLAALRALESRKVLLVDADARQDTCTWSEKRRLAGCIPKLAVRCISGKGVEPELENLALHYDDIVVDTEGRDCLGSRSVLVAAHVAVVPIDPGRINAVTVENLVRRFETAHLFNPLLKVLFVIVCERANLPLHDIAVIRALTHNIRSASLSNTKIHEGNAIRNAFAEGLSVLEYSDFDEARIAEMQSLYHEVFDSELRYRSMLPKVPRNKIGQLFP